MKKRKGDMKCIPFSFFGIYCMETGKRKETGCLDYVILINEVRVT
jgi:hypothetical protein